MKKIVGRLEYYPEGYFIFIKGDKVPKDEQERLDKMIKLNQAEDVELSIFGKV